MRKAFFSSAVILTAVLVLFLAVTVIMARSDTVPQRLSRELSQLTGAAVNINRVSLSLFAVPHITLSDISCAIGSQATLTIADIALYAAPAALLRGSALPFRLVVERPIVTIHMQSLRANKDKALSPEAVQQQVSDAITSALGRFSGLSILIHHGALHLHAADGTQIAISGLDAASKCNRKGFDLALAARSDLWETLNIQAAYETRREVSDNRTGVVRIGLNIAGIDPRACRKILTFFPDPSPATAQVYDRLLDDSRPTLSASALVPLPFAGSWHSAVSLEATVEGLAVKVPEAQCEVRDAGSTIRVHKGNIELNNAHGRSGNTRIQNGRARWDFARGGAPDDITAQFAINLQDAQGFLNLLPPGAARTELERVAAPAGLMTGTIDLRRQASRYVPRISIDQFSIRTQYRDFPQPVEIAGGTVTFQDDVLSFADCSARIGRSMVDRISLAIGFNNRSTIDISFGNATVFLDDAAAALASFEATRPATAFTRAGTGAIVIDRFALTGPLFDPRQWVVSLSAGIKNAEFAIPGEHAPARVRQGNITIEGDTVLLTNAHVGFLDAQLAGNLAVEGYHEGIRSLKIDAAGSLGAAALEKTAAWWNLPHQYRVRGPVRIEQAQVVWKPAGSTEIKAALSFAAATKVVGDVRAGRDGFRIRSLSVRDADSRCDLRLGLDKDVLDIAWQGILQKATLDRIFADNRFFTGEITGDFTATFNEKEPLRSSASGTIRLQHVGYPSVRHFPLSVAQATCSAQDNVLHIASHGVRFGTNTADITGTVGMDMNGFSIDGTVSASRISLDEYIALRPDNPETASSNEDEFWDTPLRGCVKVAVQELYRNGLKLSPCNAEILFFEKEVKIRSNDVQICGIAVPGTAALMPGHLELAAMPHVENASARHVVQCLSGEKSLITGKLDLQAELAAQGEPSSLLKELHGTVSVTLTKGKVYKSNLLTDILSFLSIRNLLSGKRFDIGKKGFPYRRFEMQGDIRGGVLHIREALFDSNALTIVGQGTVSLTDGELDLTALATPFQVQDLLLMSVPVVGVLFGKTLIGVPLKITGKVGNTHLGPGPPSAVIKGLAGLAENILKLPMRIIEPVLERANGTAKQ